ncbi:TPA: hypothetical protein PFE28_001425 [Kluyvera cryocrescens]|nr:hypothetical protein [Kluyvera cryocrescens]
MSALTGARIAVDRPRRFALYDARPDTRSPSSLIGIPAITCIMLGKPFLRAALRNIVNPISEPSNVE